MDTKIITSIIFALAILTLPGCKMPGPNEMKMSLPGFDSTTGFYANGFPTNLRLDQQGHVNLEDFPRQKHWFTKKYLSTVNALATGYPTVMPVYLPFTRDVDIEAMSDWDLDYASADAPIQLIDIDPDSNQYGRRFPLSLSITALADRYRPSHLLQVVPTFGVPLRPNTTYALIVTDRTPLDSLNYWQQNAQLAAALGVDDAQPGAVEEISRVYQPLRDFMRDNRIDPETVVGATVWTTADPTARFMRGSALVAEKAEAMSTLPVSNIEAFKDYPDYCVIRGDVEMPVYQKGKAPYIFGGGQVEWDDNGAPIEQSSRTTEFVVTIPKYIAMPAAGFPLLSYVHGAAGVARQVYERGDFDYYDLSRYPYYIAKEGEGPSMIAAERGWASSGFGGHLSVNHLPEWDGAAILVGYNPSNPDAFNNNYLTITWEQIYFRRILQRLRVDADLCPLADAGTGQTAFRFDTDTEVSMGQSMGVWGASLKVSADPKPYLGLIVGGAGGTWIKNLNSSVFNKFVMKNFIVNQPFFQGLDDANPLLMLAEWAFAATDLSVNMEQLMRYSEKSPPHVIAYSGFRDEIYPDPNQRTLYMAMGMDLVGDDIGDRENNTMMPHMQLAGARQLTYPAADNFETPFGSRLNVVMRYRGNNIALLNSGHEVMFEDDAIKHQYGCFLEYLSNGDSPLMIIGANQGDPCL